MSDLVSQNFSIYQGDDKMLTVTVLNDGGTTKDLTGGTGTFKMSQSGSADITKNTSNGLVLGNGTAKVTFTHTETATINLGQWEYKLRVAGTDDIRETVVIGAVTLYPF